MYLKINPFVTVLGQDRKVIDKHSYLIHSCDNARLQGPKSNFLWQYVVLNKQEERVIFALGVTGKELAEGK